MRSVESNFNDFLINHFFSSLSSLTFSFQIYTDWANYYLDRTKSKKRVTDLSSDCRDGLLLADVIEAVTTFKVPDLIKKPKTQQQMVSDFTKTKKVLHFIVASNVNRTMHRGKVLITSM